MSESLLKRYMRQVLHEEGVTYARDVRCRWRGDSGIVFTDEEVEELKRLAEEVNPGGHL